MKRRNHTTRIHNSIRSDPVMISSAIQLPAVEHQRLPLENTARNLTMLLYPLSSKKTNRVIRVEVQRKIIMHCPRLSTDHEHALEHLMSSEWEHPHGYHHRND